MLLAEMSESVQITGMILGFLGLVLSSVMTYLMARLNAKATLAAKEVAKVESALKKSTIVQEEKLDGIAVVGVATHTLVNSNMGIQLLLTATALRRIATITNDHEDIRAAELAEHVYADHQTKQATVDKAKEIKS